MKVSECRDCEHCVRRVWTDYYKPLNYHAIGINHAYAYCQKHKARVLEVKKCDEIHNENRNIVYINDVNMQFDQEHINKMRSISDKDFVKMLLDKGN